METPHSKEAKRLLARTAMIRSACDLDLLVFLHRHPRILITSEKLSEFVGYPLKDVAKALEAFLDAGLLERTVQHTGHAARLFQLLLDGPQGGGVRTLLEIASTRPGRQGLLEVLNGSTSSPEHMAYAPALRIVKCG